MGVEVAGAGRLGFSASTRRRDGGASSRTTCPGKDAKEAIQDMLEVAGD